MRTVVAHAPGRVSLAGGGTDIPAFYERHGGAVVASAITLGATVEVSTNGAGLELVSMDHGSRELIPAERYAARVRYPFLAEEFLTLPKAVAWHFGLDRARLAAASELPPGGGLGASAAVCVALVAAGSAFVGEQLARSGVAEVAARIEMGVLRRPCGKQDQYTAAYGGLNLLEFARDGSVAVTPILPSAEARRELSRHLVLFSNGGRRNSAGPLAELARRITVEDERTLEALNELKRIAYELPAVLERGDMPSVGELLDRGWQAKSRLHSQVSTPDIDRALSLAKRAGAYGGKLTGAGLAGSLLIACPPARRAEIGAVLATQGWLARRVDVDGSGVVCGETAGGALSC